MAKKQTNLRTSDLTRRQIDDLAAWWNTTLNNLVQECISRAWHTEHARRTAGRDPVWLVLPTRDLFPDEASAIHWLEEKQNAVRTGPAGWVTLGEDGVPETEWTLGPAQFTE